MASKSKRTAKAIERPVRKRPGPKRGFKKAAKDLPQIPEPAPPPPAPIPEPQQQERRGRGRPASLITDEMRAKVRMLIGSGMTQDEVAIVMKINKKLLVRRYVDEIASARTVMKAKAIKMVWDQAEKGSAPMIRKVFELTSIPQNREAFLPAGGTKPEKKKAEPKLGKKELQAIAAQNPDPDDPLGKLMADRAARSRMN